MRKIFTLAAAGVLAATTFGAQAQIILDGKVDATEIATTYMSGKYQLVSAYNGTHSVADHGLKALYVGTDATHLYIAVVGSFEQTTTYPGIVAYFNLPNKTGVAAGTKLAGGNDGQSPLKQKPTMDFEVDYGIRLNVSPTGMANGYISSVDYTTGNPVAGVPDTYQGSVDKVGTKTTASATSGPFLNWQAAYITSTSLAANTANSAAEFQFDLANLGLTASTPNIDMFVAYVNDGGIFTTDTFPPIVNQTTALAADQDFTQIAGKQFLTYQIGTGVLATKVAASALSLSVYPNPVRGTSLVTYEVTDRASNVNIVLTDLLGRTVRTLENSLKPVGPQTTPVDVASLATGTYLMRVQVGDKVSTSKVSVL
ncbi:T9SS type A sorting domain-containing protein [Hymenobacter sp. BRD128]|uniref:T9SS type A sorting domain-containing protein n=1 Tax=Hymenobacter sp. BRD128 TaxID=2675878 RepID=UPI001567B8BF|nr:T9SS type A sorting domain-containing protein [Hymenobacter sp. BRD128]QKG55627.1 T9SS type A sorting domain-containing protein [Hymenobacter sp. BRD128]